MKLSIKKTKRFNNVANALVVSAALGMVLSACATEYKVISRNSDYLTQLQHNQPYVIGAGDRLNIVIWGQSQLSSNTVVRPDGKISLPLIGDIHAEGLTVEELKKNVNERMSEYIQEPSASVMVSQIESHKAYILGEVGKPGEINLTGFTDVLHVIAKAGGLTVYAKKSRIFILRSLGEKQVKIKFNYSQVIKGRNLEQNIPLQPGDVIVVP